MRPRSWLGTSSAIGKKRIGQFVVFGAFFLEMKAAQFGTNHKYFRIGILATEGFGHTDGIESCMATHKIDNGPLNGRPQLKGMNKFHIQSGGKHACATHHNEVRGLQAVETRDAVKAILCRSRAKLCRILSKKAKPVLGGGERLQVFTIGVKGKFARHPVILQDGVPGMDATGPIQCF